MPRRIPHITQFELADCGAACLAMTLAYHGRHAGLEELRDATATGREGADARGIVEAARAYGLSARGVKADIHELGHLPRGSILHWEFRHFVVLDRVTRRGIHVVDPAAGRARIPLERFRRSYTGVAIALEPGADWVTGGRRAKGGFRYLRPMLREGRQVRRVLATSILLRLFALALPLFTAALVNRILPSGDRHLLYVLAAAMLALAGYYLFTEFLRAHLLLTLRTKLDMQLTLGFVEHLVDLPYAFFLKRSAGDLTMRLRSNAIVREILTTGALSALLDGTLACLYLVILFVLSPQMGLIVLGLGVLQVGVLVLARRRNQRLMAESLQIQARSQSYVYQLLTGIEDLKAAGAERRATAHWSNLFVDEINVSLARGRLDALTESATAGLRVASPLAVLAVGGAQVLNGDLSVGRMLALVALAAGFLEPLATLVTTGLQLQLLGSYMQRINDVLDAPKEQQDQNVRRAPTLSGKITAEAVSFRYSRHARPAVEDVSLEIEPGRTVAIVGRSGSGKTTLGHLLLGLYRPESGRIFYDGIDLAELEARSVRTQLGIVTQAPYLFGTSVRENISLTDPSLDLDAVIRAAKLACIDDDIAEMAMGYETMLVDGGASLSGGQRQRIALARALVHSPSILLLDEATSELDSLTERAVYESITGLGCTAIVIAHRLSTIAGADLIVVMEAGRIVERGTHEELLELRGRYHELIASQREPVREGGPVPHERPAEAEGLTQREHETLHLVARGEKLPTDGELEAPPGELVRYLNKRIRELEATSASASCDFVCECADDHCFEVVMMKAAEFDAVIAKPGRYLVANGHQRPNVEGLPTDGELEAPPGELVRYLNKRIRELEATSASASCDFVCECADDHCFEVVIMKAAEFDAVIAKPGRHLVANGHQRPNVEGLVQQHDRREGLRLTQHVAVSPVEPTPVRLVGGVVVRGVFYVLVAVVAFLVVTLLTARP